MRVDDYGPEVEYPPLEPDTMLSPGYRVIEHLHQSNNFDVYDAWSEKRACRCIVKTPRQDLIEDVKVRRGLLREGRLLARLTHPHIVRAYEALKEPYPALVLETLTGDTLSYIIETAPRRLPVPDLAHLGLHLCSAIHYLHGHNILHLDLKPSNIVSERQMAKILDLSIARRPGRSKRGAGTPQYMAPEQVRGDHVSPATDVWGIGATLYEAATARQPFNAAEEATISGTGEHTDESLGTDTDLDTYEQVLHRADPVRAHRRLPKAFANLVDGCLAPAPEERPELGELRDRLSELV